MVLEKIFVFANHKQKLPMAVILVKFFGISDSEAGWMDPQQCLALEVTYTALENGGFTKEQMKGTNTGVYIGKLNEERYPYF
jgi:hypothetical protein